MNILLLHQYYLEKTDGGGSRFNEMANLWAGQGHHITVLAGMVHYATGKKNERYQGRYIYRETREKNITVIRSHVSETYNTSYLGRFWAYFSFMLSSTIAGIFYAREKYDIILMTSPPLTIGVSGYLLSLLKRVPYIFEVRDLWPESAIETGILTNRTLIKFSYGFEKFIYRRAAGISVLTPAFKNKIIAKGFPEQKITFIPNAADFKLSDTLMAEFNAVEFRRRLGFEEKLVIVYVGVHGFVNHLIQLVDAAEMLREEPVLFLLIGDGVEKKKLKEKAEALGLENIRFIDSVPKEEVLKYILAADLGATVLKKLDIFKTIYSNKTFDYMSCKKPILMAVEGISKKLVEDADCGVFVEPENTDDFVKKVRFYLTNKSLLKKQGENGYRFARKYFDRRILADKYLAVMAKITGEKNEGSA